MTKRILVIGGGIAGPVTALALRQAGFDPVVHEAYDESADGVGAFLTLASNGLSALETLGLAEPVAAAGFVTPRMRLSLGARELGWFPMSSTDPAVPSTVTITRAALYRVLREEVRRQGIPVEYGKRMTAAESDARGVTARFADGTTATGDLLIGADGLRSTVRTVIDPAAPAPRYVPLLNTGGYARGVRVPGEPGTAYMGFGRRAFFAYLPHPDGSVWWFANVPSRTEPTRADLAAITDWRGRLREVYAGDDLPAQALIDATADIVAPYPTYDFPTVPTWHRDRMIIVGDAAHATSPAAGQGASMAVEDAVTLARCLRSDRPTAFAEYERLRRPRVEKVVRMGKRNGDAKAPGVFGRLLLPLAIRMLPTRDMSWLLDHRV
ncbi:FAD-dependent oxidoreductase [Actinokineospora fastidiosa]|uniref:FAD-dependent oxidoreductase n=1 Tax=Actinokineospora fastidiosa TaxID=1816 RepID=A0A918L9K4_9PSEU|nr:FAD-dependent monooxygenase [Actinokineospora fastidiosa]GGS21350.1 FAD-dependent oxidoreductase [Actinokineospora fastidiosa]